MKRVVVNPGTCLMVHKVPYLPGSTLELENDAEAERLQRFGKVTILPDELPSPKIPPVGQPDLHDVKDQGTDEAPIPGNLAPIKLDIQDIEDKSADVIGPPAAELPPQKAPSKSAKAAR